MVSGCDTLSRWKMAGTSTLVAFIPREVDKHVGELAERSQTARQVAEPVPEGAHLLIQQLAEPLTKNVDLAPLQPRIQMMGAGIPNAFAFPHGGIFVTTKLIQISKTPDEILAVLAHELAHVVQRHSMQQLVTVAGTSLALNMILGDIGGLADLASAGSQLLTLKFSRDHERDADAVGVDILRRANLPLGGVAAFFERIQDYEKSVSALPGDGDLLSLLKTHPPTQERIDTARALVSPPDAKILPAQIEAYEKLKKMF